LRRAVLADVAKFVAAQYAEASDPAGLGAAGDIVMELIKGGNCLRSGNRCG